MSYAKKYEISASGKQEPTEVLFRLDIYEKDYVGAVQTIEQGPNPFNVSMITGTDEVFEPVNASTLTANIDITDFTGELPDFTSIDDRKYWCKFYGNISSTDYLIWQGFMLMDSTQVLFSTGRIFVQLSFTDGLAILKSIPYVPTNSDINVLETLSQTITNCLNKIDLPDGYNLNYVCGIFADGMVTSASPFKQSYIYPSNWIDADLIYTNCYDILSDIVKSFGCQIFQSNGEFWVANLNERGEDSVRIFQTTNLDGAESVFVRWKEREILPYLNPTDTPYYFQENEQLKILRKGYGCIELIHDIDFSPEYIDNGLFKRVTAGVPDNWTFTPGTSATLTQTTYNNITGFEIFSGINSSYFAPNSVAPISGNSELVLSFGIKAIPVTALPGVQLVIEVDAGGGNQWRYRNDVGADTPEWVYNFVAADYLVNISSDQYQQVSITIPPPPVNGPLSIRFEVGPGRTPTTVFLANVRLTFNSFYKQQKITACVDASSNYKKTVNIPLGAASSSYYGTTIKGALLDLTGALLVNWYRYNKSEAYDSLMRVIARQYINIQGKTQINLDSTVRGLWDDRNVIGPIVQQRKHIIGAIDTVTVQDTTTNSLSINGKYYVNGALNYNYFEDTINGTMLEVSDVDVTATFTDETILNQ